MNRQWWGGLLLVSLFPGAVLAQQNNRTSLFGGFKANNQATVSSEQPVSLPADHGPHNGYQIEWWYLTLLLENDAGEPFNYQFTLFKFARPEMASNWGEGAVWMGHSSLHTHTSHYFDEKFAQQGTGIAGFSTEPVNFFIDNWQWQSEQDATLFPARLNATSGPAGITLALTADKPFIKHGQQGVSFKTGDGDYRSYYYSQPFINASGQIKVEGEPHQVSGIGWYDHEWTSQLVDEDALGWDWFSLHFDDGRKLMAFTMYVDGGEAYTTGTLISAHGESLTLGPDELQISPLKTSLVAGRDIPVEWQITIPAQQIDISTKAFKTDQWNDSRFPYYEGAVSFGGSHAGKGYMELTGY
ncbi:lipocalin-like domain-containing protein [uncultured Alteromonas sp.]|jgi:predicted secreted hydrolase|uniref:lipocalin-like domain-containing protein n=1 Tax=uncultured Alteromonas sp. TaxID=179113 RepID=UPI0025D66D43|nr:lipocalin-like domain-containing protein [uncultured Alteromonas sp.]